MPTSEFMKNFIKTWQIVTIVLVTGLLLIWLNQSSLDRFWQQKYHQNPPWSGLTRYPVWNYGSYLQEGVAAASDSFLYYASGQQAKELAAADKQPASTEIKSLYFPPAYQVGLHFINGYIRPAETLSLSFPELLNRDVARTKTVRINSLAKSNLGPIVPKTEIVLKAENKVLFAGDSMMQGVAPQLKRMLQKDYKIESINLSKQSTGLAYPRFFNWPQTISDTLASNPDIKLLVVFLGPNDPWDMPPSGKGKYLRFKSDEWEQMYRQRIENILSVARQHNVDVIWVGPPNMKKNNLSDGMKYLRTLYQTEVEQNGEIYLSVNDIFKYKDDLYSDYFGDGSSQIKLRSGDGIHFSPKGQQAIADKIFALIHVEQEVKNTNESEQTAPN